jgi:hypothetical protein
MKWVCLRVFGFVVAAVFFSPHAVAQQLPAYVPPSGFTMAPADSVPAAKLVWKPVSVQLGTGKFVQNFTALAKPFSGTVQMAANGARTIYSSGMLGRTASDVASAVCGAPARTFTLDVPAGTLRASIVQQLLVKDGTLFVFTYTREAGTPQDATIVKWMQSFCPPQNGDLTKVSPPNGWATMPGAEFVPMATWLGTPGSVIQLVQGPAGPSLTDAAKAMTSLLAQNSQSNVKSVFDVGTPQTGTLCGNQAVFLSMTLHLGQVTMLMHEAITQNANKAYGLTYGHLSSMPDDPAAVASLKTLCANGVMPSPSPSPSASPEPSSTP